MQEYEKLTAIKCSQCKRPVIVIQKTQEKTKAINYHCICINCNMVFDYHDSSEMEDALSKKLALSLDELHKGCAFATDHIKYEEIIRRVNAAIGQVAKW